MKVTLRRFDYHRDQFYELLNRKLLAACAAAAEQLADVYRGNLTRNIAPPHSNIGEIPHAYLGWKPDGYGPVRFPETLNNPGQEDFLANYIDFSASDVFFVSAAVGFKPSHVGSEFAPVNYLLWHDRHGRPWVEPILRQNIPIAAEIAKASFEATI